MDFFTSRRSRKESEVSKVSEANKGLDTAATSLSSNKNSTISNNNVKKKKGSWLMQMSPISPRGRRKQTLDLSKQTTEEVLDACPLSLDSESESEQPSSVVATGKSPSSSSSKKSNKNQSAPDSKKNAQSTTNDEISSLRGRDRRRKPKQAFFSRSLSHPRKSRSRSQSISTTNRKNTNGAANSTKPQRRIRSLSRPKHKSTTSKASGSKAKSKKAGKEHADSKSTNTKNNTVSDKKKKKLKKKQRPSKIGNEKRVDELSPERAPDKHPELQAPESKTPDEASPQDPESTNTTAQDLTESSVGLEELQIEEVPRAPLQCCYQNDNQQTSKSTPELPNAKSEILISPSPRPIVNTGNRRHSISMTRSGVNDNASLSAYHYPPKSTATHRRASLNSALEHQATMLAPLPLPPKRGRRSSMSATISRSDLEISPMLIPATTGQLRRSSLSNLGHMPHRRGSISAPPLYSLEDEEDYQVSVSSSSHRRPQLDSVHHQDSSSSISSSAHSRPIMEVSPGVFLPLRGAAETRQAVKDDHFISHKCEGCKTEIFCIADAAQILCPSCQLVQPLWGSDALENEGGVGLGFTVDDLESMQWGESDDDDDDEQRRMLRQQEHQGAMHNSCVY